MARKKAVKRKPSAKQLKALAAGRKKRASKSTAKKRTVKKSTVKKVKLHKDDLQPLQININGDSKKMKRRKSTKKAAVAKKSRRRVTRYSGLNIGKKDFVKPLINSAVAVAGGIAGSMIANKVPVADARLKAGIPILGGLLLGMSKFGRKEMVQSLASGMMVAGGLALVRQFAPTLPLLAGENEVDLLDTQYMGSPLELGYESEEMGIAEPLVNLEGEDEEDNYYSAANIG